MNAWARFCKHGAEDADRRVAAAFAPVRTDAADRYLQTSRVVMALDHATLRLRDWWLASESGRGLSTLSRGFTDAPVSVRYGTVASVLLIAVISHLALMLMQGPRPGWFWLVIPAMVVLFAALLVAGSRSSQTAN